MKKKIILITSFLFVYNYIFAQENKVYEGNYTCTKSGFAKYNYYENDNYERVYNGLFNFTTGNPNAKLKQGTYREEKGEYVNDKKNSKWYRKSKYEELNANYKNGYLDGVYTFKEWNIFKKELELNVNVFFENGVLKNDFYIKNKINPKATIKGTINKNGYLEGVCEIKYSPKDVTVNEIRKYKNGILYFCLVKEVETGEVVYKMDSTTFVENILKNYENNEQPILFQNKKYIISNTDDFNKSEVKGYVWSEKFMSSLHYRLHNNFFENRGEICVKHVYQNIIIDYNETEQGKLEVKYRGLITKANNNYKEKKYKEAIAVYEEALKFEKLRNIEYINSQIKNATEFLTKNSIYEQYIDQADNLVFKPSPNNTEKEKNAEEAIDLYKKAIEVRAEVSYPPKCMRIEPKYCDKNHPHEQIKRCEEKISQIYVSQNKYLWVNIESKHRILFSSIPKKNKKAYLIIYNKEFDNPKDQYLHLKRLEEVQRRAYKKIKSKEVLDYANALKAFGVDGISK